MTLCYFHLTSYKKDPNTNQTQSVLRAVKWSNPPLRGEHHGSSVSRRWGHRSNRAALMERVSAAHLDHTQQAAQCGGIHKLLYEIKRTFITVPDFTNHFLGGRQGSVLHLCAAERQFVWLILFSTENWGTRGRSTRRILWAAGEPQRVAQILLLPFVNPQSAPSI